MPETASEPLPLAAATEQQRQSTSEAVAVEQSSTPSINAVPAVPQHVSAARTAFEEALKQWVQQGGSEEPVCRTLSAMLVAQGTPYLDEVPFSLRSVFSRFRRQYSNAVNAAVHSARQTLIPAMSEELPPSRAIRMDETFREGAD